MKTIKEKQREVMGNYANELTKYIRTQSRNCMGVNGFKVICLIGTLASLDVPPYAIGLRHETEFHEKDLIILQYKLPSGKNLYYSLTGNEIQGDQKYFYKLKNGYIIVGHGFIVGSEAEAINSLIRELKGTCPETPRIVYNWVRDQSNPFDNIIASFAFANKINS